MFYSYCACCNDRILVVYVVGQFMLELYNLYLPDWIGGGEREKDDFRQDKKES